MPVSPEQEVGTGELQVHDQPGLESETLPQRSQWGWELIHWEMTIAMQEWRPEFKSLESTFKKLVWLHTYNLRDVVGSQARRKVAIL